MKLQYHHHIYWNMANLRDLIAATDLVILTKFDQIVTFLAGVTLKFDGWSRKTIGNLFLAPKTYVCHFVPIQLFKLELTTGNTQIGSKSFFTLCDPEIWQMMSNGEFKLELQSRNAPFDSNSWCLVPCDLEIWWMTLKNNRPPLLPYCKLCASFRSHQSIQTGVTVQKCPIWIKIVNFFVPCDLEIWRITVKNNRTPLLCYSKLLSSFHSRLWIQTGLMVWKILNWHNICFDLCNLNIWSVSLNICKDITFVNGKNSWKFHDDTMTRTL